MTDFDNRAPDYVPTMRDAIEIGLSASMEDVGLKLSDNRWDRLCRNATSEIQRQLRKVNSMGTPELSGSFNEQQVQLGKLLLREQQETNELLRRLVEQQNGANEKAATKPREGSAHGTRS